MSIERAEASLAIKELYEYMEDFIAHDGYHESCFDKERSQRDVDALKLAKIALDDNETNWTDKEILIKIAQVESALFYRMNKKEDGFTEISDDDLHSAHEKASELYSFWKTVSKETII